MQFDKKIFGFLFGLHDKILHVPFAFEEGLPEKHIPQTWVTLMLGDDKNFHDGGGHEPFISLWDNNGRRLGQYVAKGNKMEQHNDIGKSVFKISHTQTLNPMGTAQYLMMSHAHDDDICVAAIQVANGALNAIFYGDLGAFCGMGWFFSRRKPSDKVMHPKCVWLGGSHTKSLSFHVNDMLGTDDKLNMYRQDPKKYLCKSTPRFAYWENLIPDGRIPFFNPPLEYHRDHTSGQEGADKDPERAVDRFDWDKKVLAAPKLVGRSMAPTAENYTLKSRSTKLSKRQGFNHDVGRLIVTEAEGHEASAVCNSTTSYGWDVASLREGKYCDMTVRKLYPFCDWKYRNNCFNLEKKVLVGRGGISARGEVSAEGVPGKAYITTDHWKD